MLSRRDDFQVTRGIMGAFSKGHGVVGRCLCPAFITQRRQSQAL